MEKNNLNPLTKRKLKVLGIICIPLILVIALVGVLILAPKPTNMAITTYDLVGKQVSTAQYRGKVQIVEFYATWCPSCAEVTQTLAKTLDGADSIGYDLVVWSVSVDVFHDQPNVVEEYVTDHALTQYVVDGRWMFTRDLDDYATLFEVSTIPHLFILDPELDVAHSLTGEVPTVEDLLEMLQALS